MKPVPMNLGKIVANIEVRPQHLDSAEAGWCSDIMTILITKEELLNLKALAQSFGYIISAEAVLDSVE